jgi:hypothetical protein
MSDLSSGYKISKKAAILFVLLVTALPSVPIMSETKNWC